MSRCGCTTPSSCLCAVAAGVSTTVGGSGALGDPWTVGLALSTDPDQLAVISANRLLVPGGGPRLSFTTGVTATQSVSVTVSSSNGKFKKRGRQVNGWMAVQLGSSGTAANPLQLSIGAIPIPVQAGMPVGTFTFVKTSATARVYVGMIYYVSVGSYQLQADSGTSSSQYLGQNPSFGVVSNDLVTVLFDYEAAA